MSKAFKIQREVELEMPTMPNYLTVAGTPPGKRQDGIREQPKIDVAELNDEQMTAFTVAWTVAFRAHVHERRKLLQEAKVTR